MDQKTIAIINRDEGDTDLAAYWATCLTSQLVSRGRTSRPRNPDEGSPNVESK